ncbi:MAG: hypothetical protein BWY77_00224 [bacterium ADurb.Bin431]|nr:MAG: hypothetical protein BWY77_00224 [bacterium ADurb.Bin431]HNY91691.1 hypothetical protein [bacterium]HOC24047.1 hypothetical protein [bacterium]HOY43690.1 hypothetical protein [bacterium]HPG81878.1 hypothetical protein [bacterium]
MRKALWIGCAALLIIGCAGTEKMMLQPPQPDKSLVVGAVLVENLGLEEVYEAKTARIWVVLVGKGVENGVEKIEGYRCRTDENGYFMLQNVPRGTYIIKGIEVDLGFSIHMILNSRWEGNTQIFEPGGTMIDHIVRVWPEMAPERVVDLGIRYFRFDYSGRIQDQTFAQLRGNSLGLKDKVYTMPSPAAYFSQKNPEWGWFK